MSTRTIEAFRMFAQGLEEDGFLNHDDIMVISHTIHHAEKRKIKEAYEKVIADATERANESG